MGTTFPLTAQLEDRDYSGRTGTERAEAVQLFSSDGADLLQSPLARVVIDDGRRYLERTTQSYDLITVDPPPPVEAAGSSLLYSEEFYAVARKAAAPGRHSGSVVPRRR